MSRYLVPVILLFLALSLEGYAQLFSIQVAPAAGVSGQAHGLRHGGITYINAKEFTDLAGLSYSENSRKRKISIGVRGHRLKFSADNAFVVVTDPAEREVVQLRQIPVEVRYDFNAYYLPLPAVRPLFQKYGGLNWSLSPDGKTLRLQTGTAVTTTIANPPATAGKKTYDVTHLTVEERKNGILVRIHCRDKIAKASVTTPTPGKVVIILSNATVDAQELAQTPSAGEIKKVRAEQRNGNAVITLVTDAKVKSSGLSRDVRSNDLLIALYTPAEVQKIYAEEKQQRENAADRNRWKLDCIVIDPGHGGKDPGAIGVTGVKEKNVALGIALKLGKLIKKNMPGVRVVYTRKDDRFIELDKRGQIANKNMGKLFISIHCNTMPKKPSSVQGFESYLLRPGRTDEAIRIAEFENSVIKLEKDYQKRYTKLTPENFILINMAQSAYMHFSEQFAELLHKEIKENGPLTSRGVKQAGLFVLVGASMPGILIETGFLSNPKEEKFLASNRGQQELANRLFAAIRKYAKDYSKDLKK